jgi:hypothetical protein
MRFLRLIPAVAALTGALAIAPPGASAFKHPSPLGRCHVSINLAPKVIVANDPITIWGRLSCRRPPGAADRAVKLFQHLRGTPGLTYVQSVTTDANGFYEIEKAGGDVTTNRFFVVRSHRAQSARREVLVEAEVNLSGPAEGTRLYTGPANAVTFTGTVDPADAGARVILQRQNALTGDEWHAIDRGVAQSDGTFSITHTFRYPGDADIRVLVRSGPINIPSRSNVLTSEISRAQNPALTIDSSADPIIFGQSMTITGTLAGHDTQSQQVTLYARTAGQRYAPIAQATTPLNAAAASQPFAIEITPAPIVALVPENSTNSSRPSEGQVTGTAVENRPVAPWKPKPLKPYPPRSAPVARTNITKPPKRRHLGKRPALRSRLPRTACRKGAIVTGTEAATFVLNA